MAHAASELVQEPAGRKARRTARGTAAGGAQKRPAIALDLGPLLAPYKKRGRLAIRVEQMPLQARLSAGRNNGDNSWSLAADELADLAFQPPARFDKPHTLAIRIMVHEGDGVSTAAVLDYEVSPDGTGSATLPVDIGEIEDNTAEVRRLQAELADAARRLAEQDAAVAAARDEAEVARADLALAREAWQTDLEAQRADAREQAARERDAALADAEARWKTAEADRLAAAQMQWQRETDAALAEARNAAGQSRATGDAELRKLKDELTALRKTLSARETDLAALRTEMADAQADAEQARAAALQEAEERWTTAEAARRAQADAAWQAKLDAARADASAAAGRDRAARESELAQAKDALVGLRETLTARERDLAALRADMEKARSDAAEDQRAALQRAEDAWKAGEAGRLAAAEAQWQEKIEAARADAQAASAQSQTATQADLRRLTEELTRVHKTVRDRDDELTRMRAALMKTEADAAEAQSDALRAAEARWKADEAARLAAAEAGWRAQAEQTHPGPEVAALAARCAQAEAALEESQTRASAAEIEIERLRGEWTTLQDSLAERDAELEQWRAAAAEAAPEPDHSHEIEGLRAELADAAARYEQAETALIELRKQRPSFGAGEMTRLRDEVDTLNAVVAERDAELSRLRIAADRWHEYQARLDAEETGRTGKDTDFPPRRGMLRDVALVMAVAIAAVLFGPRIVASLPYSVQAQLPAFLTGYDDAADDAAPSPSPAAAPAQTKAPAPKPATDIVTHGVNLRTGPSSGTTVVTTLGRGTGVAEIERRGAWVHVRVPDEDGKTAGRTGWIYKSYLKPAKAAAQD